MKKFTNNVLDLVEFRLNKQNKLIHPISGENSSPVSNKLDNRIENIKQSISRINKLMEELRSLSNKSK